MEQSLQPDQEMWVDVGQLIRMQTPDKNGNTLPATLTSGSYEITDLSHHGAGTLFEGKVIYDKMYGHAAYGCALCCGYATINYGFWYDPLGIPDGGTAPQGVQAEDMCNGGALEDVSDAFYGSWTTGNGSIATANHYGTHTGVGLGSTTSYATGWLNTNQTSQLCPLKAYEPRGNDNVQTPYQVEPIATIDSQQATPSFCGNNNMYGWIRDVTNQLQYQSGAPVRSAGITVGDTIQVDSQNNGLGIIGAQVDSYTTDSNGSWPDRYYVCSTACPGSLSQSLASQSWTWNGLGVPHVNSITYKCGSITIDGH